MRHAATHALYTYWNELRGNRLAPRRFELEPARMGDSLPDTFILQREDAGTFPFRVAGTRFCDRFKREFRGHDFLGGWPAADRELLRSLLNTISVKGGGVLFLTQAETATGRALQAEIVLLPLLHVQPCADRFLGSFFPLEMPAWLGFEPIVSLTMLSYEIVAPWSAGRGETLANERQTPFMPRVRHSSIVRSDRRQFRVFEGGLSDAHSGKS